MKDLIIAVDTYYYIDKAKTVGVIFNTWTDKEPTEIISSWTTNFGPYIPGEFWKRELSCILNLLKNVDKKISTIIVDGYIDLLKDGDYKISPGLGRKLSEVYLDKEVIGVAKSKFGQSDKISEIIRRGPKGSKPLYVQACKMSNRSAGLLIQKMYGKNKLPDLLRILDKETKKEREH